MKLPEIGERVTVLLWPWQEPRPCVVTATHPEIEDSRAFSVRIDDAYRRIGEDGEFHLWSFTPDFVEGVGWCRGWDGPAVDALQAAEALT